MQTNNKTGKSIFVKFYLPKTSVSYIIQATNQEDKVNAINGELRLIKGRVYYLPINEEEINSDDYEFIKVFSDLSDKLQVLFIKSGFACVIPIVNNFRIKNNQLLCGVFV
jgi:hypothetical protein